MTLLHYYFVWGHLQLLYWTERQGPCGWLGSHSSRESVTGSLGVRHIVIFPSRDLQTWEVAGAFQVKHKANAIDRRPPRLPLDLSQCGCLLAPLTAHCVKFLYLPPLLCVWLHFSSESICIYCRLSLMGIKITRRPKYQAFLSSVSVIGIQKTDGEFTGWQWDFVCCAASQAMTFT